LVDLKGIDFALAYSYIALIQEHAQDFQECGHIITCFSSILCKKCKAVCKIFQDCIHKNLHLTCMNLQRLCLGMAKPEDQVITQAWKLYLLYWGSFSFAWGLRAKP